MDKRIRLLIADDIAETRDLIRQLIAINAEKIEIVGEAQNGEEASNLAISLKPDLILMDINMPILNGLEATAKIIQDNPNSIVIIMSVQSETEYLKQAMFSGAKEYIIKPFDYDTLIGTLLKTYNKYHSLNPVLATETLKPKTKLLSFFSTKGGVGKSFLAVSSALAYSTVLEKKTLLIDFDLQFGDIALMIDQNNSKTIYDCVIEGDYKEFEAIEPYLVAFNPMLDVLLAPKSPEEAEAIAPEMVEWILKSVQGHYDVVFMDLPISFNDLALSVLDQSDHILYISSMDILSLKNTKTGFGVMKSLNYPDEKMMLIINKRNESYGIKMPDVEKLFGRKPYMSLVEDDKNTCLSINMGMPFLLNPRNKGTKLYKEIVNFSKKIAEE